MFRMDYAVIGDALACSADANGVIIDDVRGLGMHGRVLAMSMVLCCKM